jgi:hypothetical protein
VGVLWGSPASAPGSGLRARGVVAVTTFADLRWHTRLVLLKYRVRLPEPRYEYTGRVVNGIYREVRRIAS